MAASKDSVPLSKAERLRQLENDFIRTLSETDRCEKPEQSAGGGGGGGNTGGTLSRNADTGGESMPVNTSLQPALPNSTEGEPSSTSSSGGKDHDELESADNNAILRAQIKEQADKETDPDIKKALMEKYEALK